MPSSLRPYLSITVPVLVLLASVAGCGDSASNSPADAGPDRLALDAAQEDAAPQTDAPPQEDAPAASGIGDPCTSSGWGDWQGTCADGQMCVSEDMTDGEFVNGYCTQQCGGGASCPWDAICVTIDTSQGEMQVCAKSCTADAQCRTDDGHKCLADMGNVCWPWSPPPGTVDGGACLDQDAGPQMDDPNRVFGASQQLAPPANSIMEAETHVVLSGDNVAAAYIAVFQNGSSKMAVNVSHDRGDTFGAAHLVDDTITSYKSDPVLAYSADGACLFLTWIGYDYNSSGSTQNMRVFVARSDDHGETWATPVDASGSDSATANMMIDKPWIATGPDGVYATYSRFNDTTGVGSIRIVRSGDNGVTWDAPVTVDDGSCGSTVFCNLAFPATDPSGNVYVGWLGVGGSTDGSSANDVYVARWDAGSSWGTFGPKRRANTNADQVVFNDVVLVPSQTTSDVYAVYVAGSPAEIRWDIRMAHSADQGDTWSPAITINDDGTCAAHFLPTAVMDASERVHVSWYDNRFGIPAGGLFYAVYDPAGGVGPSEFISDELFEFTIERDTMNWLGDYTGFAVDATTIHASWADPRGSANVSHVRVAKGTLP